MSWFDVCSTDELVPNRGVAALFGTRQVAVFLLEPEGEVVAIDNRDPFSDASVLSRGIVGSAGGVRTVASPVFKQRFDLYTGKCLDDPEVAIATFPTRIVDGRIEVEVP